LQKCNLKTRGGRRMLMVDQYEYIRIAHRVYGKKIREIARETGHSRNTIKKGIGVGPSYCIDIFG
jgi:hypothetical protein